MTRLLEFAERNLQYAKDNLFRAIRAKQNAHPTEQYGESGQNLNEIIEQYERLVKDAEEAVQAATALEAK